MNAPAERVVLITNEEDIIHASHSLKAMAHPLRLEILCILGGTTEVSVQDIVELVGTSVTSSSNIGRGPDGEKQLADLRAARPHLHYVDGRYRGYYVLDVTRERLQADFYAMKTIESRSRDERFVKGYVAPAGQMHLTEERSPAPTRRSSDPAPAGTG
jgi:DNA-binding transcriptional ArsR family regulator